MSGLQNIDFNDKNLNEKQYTIQLAQSASTLGAGILGFGIGAKWGAPASHFAFAIILVGAVLHVSGMYILEMKDSKAQMHGYAKALWISAWICLIALVAVLIYMLVT